MHDNLPKEFWDRELEYFKELTGESSSVHGASEAQPLQAVSPSANCCAGAGADALSDSLISSVVAREEAVQPLPPEQDAIEVMMCSALLKHLDATQVAAVLKTYLQYRGNPNTCELLQYRLALTAQRERAIPRNKD